MKVALGDLERTVERHERSECVGTEEHSKEADYRLVEVMEDAFDFTSGPEKAPDRVALPSGGILLFSSSAAKVTSLGEPKRHTAKRILKEIVYHFSPEDLVGVLVAPIAPWSITSTIDPLVVAEGQKLIGTVIVPQDPLPHRSRYWPTLPSRARPLPTSSRRVRSVIEGREAFSVRPSSRGLRGRGRGSRPQTNPRANGPEREKTIKKAIKAPPPSSVRSVAITKAATSTGKKKQVPKNLLL